MQSSAPAVCLLLKEKIYINVQIMAFINSKAWCMIWKYFFCVNWWQRYQKVIELMVYTVYICLFFLLLSIPCQGELVKVGVDSWLDRSLDLLFQHTGHFPSYQQIPTVRKQPGNLKKKTDWYTSILSLI